MRQGYLVALPPGAGKTRIVLQKIKQLAKGNWQNAINNLLVLGPNAKLKRIWLREIVLAVVDKRSTFEKEIDKIRKKSVMQLTKLLKDEYKIQLQFKTYQQIKKCRNFKSYSFLVLDEWHRFNIFEHCRLFIEEFGNPHILSKSAKGCYGNYTFFVSATPMNPVLEQEAENLIEEPKDDDSMITESRKKAIYTLMGLLGDNTNAEICDTPFSTAVKKLGVKLVNKYSGWEKPNFKRNNNTNETDWILDSELNFLAQASDYEQNSINDWKSKEAAWVIGLVRTSEMKKSESYKLVKNQKGQNKKSFGFKYVSPYIAIDCGKIKDAGDWLREKHTRVQRLIDRLEQECIIEKNGDGKYRIAGKKALIFCIHQGVAQGLQYALSQVIENSGYIASAVDEFNTDIENKFNTKKKPPFILIATDKMSESIDLHGACNVIIHYELPWSPLRLLQRVGRLTRKLPNGKSNNTYVYHIIIPGSVEEERVNRLLRRTLLLAQEGAWPKELFGGTEENWKKIARSLIGSGPSLHLKEEILEVKQTGQH